MFFFAVFTTFWWGFRNNVHKSWTVRNVDTQSKKFQFPNTKNQFLQKSQFLSNLWFNLIFRSPRGRKFSDESFKWWFEHPSSMPQMLHDLNWAFSNGMRHASFGGLGKTHTLFALAGQIERWEKIKMAPVMKIEKFFLGLLLTTTPRTNTIKSSYTYIDRKLSSQ